MTPSLMRYSTANLSRQKKESFNLKTGLLKLASLRIRKKKPWRKRTEPQTAVGQHGLYRYVQDGSPQEGRKGQGGYLKNWSETSKTDKEREYTLKRLNKPHEDKLKESHTKTMHVELSKVREAARSDLSHTRAPQWDKWLLPPRKAQRPADCGMMYLNRSKKKTSTNGFRFAKAVLQKWERT